MSKVCVFLRRDDFGAQKEIRRYDIVSEENSYNIWLIPGNDYPRAENYETGYLIKIIRCKLFRGNSFYALTKVIEIVNSIQEINDEQVIFGFHIPGLGEPMRRKIQNDVNADDQFSDGVARLFNIAGRERKMNFNFRAKCALYSTQDNASSFLVTYGCNYTLNENDLPKLCKALELKASGGEYQYYNQQKYLVEAFDRIDKQLLACQSKAWPCSLNEQGSKENTDCPLIEEWKKIRSMWKQKGFDNPLLDQLELRLQDKTKFECKRSAALSERMRNE